MSEPTFIVKISERTPNGSLTTSSIVQIKNVLQHPGMILLPSDTCYSLAAQAPFVWAYKTINTILNRSDIPISLAFSSFNTVQDYVDLHLITASLLESFTPGAITVICACKSKIQTGLQEDVVRSTDGTIGIRIPDSIVEREVAACTKFPITTVAIRDKDGHIVQNFEQAIDIVSMGAKVIPNFHWAAIEGAQFFHKNSSVVRVNEKTRQIEMIRDGEISRENIIAASKKIPEWYYEGWT